jgi:hypothetical protein
MDIPSDKYKPNYGARLGPFLAVLRTIGGLVRRPTRFFALSEEDRSKAGIFLGGEGRD